MFRVQNWRVLGACAWLVAAAGVLAACAGAPVQAARTPAAATSHAHAPSTRQFGTRNMR